MEITYRPMTAADIGSVPIGHMGSAAEVAARIERLGSAAMLAFDGDQHVGQLQFRAHDPGVRSPNSLWDPLYWGDFGAAGPVAELATDAISIYCYHVGQLDESDDRDERYLGRGIGLRLLDELISWARENDVGAVVAKSAPDPRAVMAFMGGQPASSYAERGFEVTASWVDDDLAEAIIERELVGRSDLPDAATVSRCVLRLR